MAVFPHEPAAQLTDDGSNHLLLAVGRTIRDNFHVLCGLSIVFLMVALPWVMLGTVVSWTVAWPLLVLTTAPVWLTIVWTSDRMLAGDAVGWRAMVQAGRRLALPALAIGILPAVCGTVLLGVVHASTDSTLMAMALPMVVGLAAAVCVLVIPAVALASRLELTGFTLWQAGAVVVIRRPTQVLGTVALAGIGCWLALALGPAVLMGVAPLGVMVAAITLPDAHTGSG